MVRPPIQNSSRYFSRLKRVCHTQTFTNTEHHISILRVQLSSGSPFLLPDKNRKFLQFFIINIRECSSTLEVGLQHAVPSTIVKFKPLSRTQTLVAQNMLTSSEHNVSGLHSPCYLPGCNPTTSSAGLSACFQYLQSESYVKMPVRPDTTSLHHCLKNKQLKRMVSVVRIQVF